MRAARRLKVYDGLAGERRLELHCTDGGISRYLRVQARLEKEGGREFIERALSYTLGAKTGYELGGDVVRCSIDLPLVRRVDEDARVIPSSPTIAGRRVLVVEDDYFLARETSRMLATLGAELLGPVPTIDAALGIIAVNARIDGAVLDINLGEDGPVYPVADALRDRGICFVFTTGYDRNVVPARFSGVKHVQKPFRPEQLIEALFGSVSERAASE